MDRMQSYPLRARTASEQAVRDADGDSGRKQDQPTMTFSIVARCAETGQLGIAISSSSIAVGARCPWLRPSVVAVGTQNITLPSLGPQILDLLEQGMAPSEAVAAVFAGQDHRDYRQVTVIDRLGRTAHFSGSQTLGVHAALSGEQCVAAGNMLANPDV